jgi:sugar phosphate isomerase/epimerase
MTSRRDAVKTLAALAAAGWLPRAAAAGTMGAAPGGAAGIERLGVQLYTVRAAMAKDMPGTLAAVATLGYREVEFAGYFGHTPAEVRTLLGSHGLTAPSTHLGLDDVRARFDATAESAHAIGVRYLTVASLDMRGIRTLDDWKRTADTFNEVGRRAQVAGLRFAYHNHVAEFVAVDGRIPMDILIGGTDPALVAFEMDLYWATKAGHDPRTFFARFPGRFEMVHVKDATAAPEMKMTEVGSGIIDWTGIFAQHAKAGIQHYFVEHDDPADPIDSIRKSANYLKSLRF